MLIICYKKYERFYEDDAITKYEYIGYKGTIAQFEEDFPDYKIQYVFSKEDNLLR